MNELSKVSVCHILPALPAHGAEQLLVDLLKNFDRDRFDLSVILISEEGPLAREVRNLGIPVHLFLRKSRFDFSVLGKIRSHVLENRIDIVHTHLITADLWGRLALVGTKTRLVSTAHNVFFNFGRIQSLLDHALSHITDAIICVSSRVRTSLRHEGRLSPHRLVVIDNGIDFSRMETSVTREESRKSLLLGGDDFVLGIIGRLSPVKNHSRLLGAVARVLKEHDWPNLKLLVVGEGELDSMLRDEVRSLGISDHVRFLGLRRDIPAILKALDALVIPSTREGLPIVLLEAMKAKLPVIATGVGGIPDVIEDGKTGILVDPVSGNLAEAIVRLHDDPVLRATLGHAAEEYVNRKFNVRHIVDQYSRLYRSLVFRKKLSSPQRSLLRGVAHISGVLPKGRSVPPISSLRVLMYHRVSDSTEPDILNTPPFMFNRQMEWLRDEGYRVLSSEEAMRGLLEGSLPPRSVLITFDDGYRDNFTEAYPVLRKSGFPAVIFPSTDFVLGVSGHPRYRNWAKPVEYLTPEQIREMAENGIDFGSHGKTHAHFPGLSRPEAGIELKESRKHLEGWTGKAVTLFAYPNGLYTGEHMGLLESLDFRGAFTTHAGTNTKETHRFELRRTEISGKDSLEDFSMKLEGRFDQIQRISQNVRRLTGRK
ncbi:MAG: glycosyltransferase [Nitrospirota bacterium]|nr:glycosyltransferase [Nitrospirota bacterium]